jgi:hypothetical protein
VITFAAAITLSFYLSKGKFWFFLIFFFWIFSFFIPVAYVAVFQHCQIDDNLTHNWLPELFVGIDYFPMIADYFPTIAKSSFCFIAFNN